MLLLFLSKVESRVRLPHNSNPVLGSRVEMNVALIHHAVDLGFVAGSDKPLFVTRFQHFKLKDLRAT